MFVESNSPELTPYLDKLTTAYPLSSSHNENWMQQTSPEMIIESF
jgi:hypothetical protein